MNNEELKKRWDSIPVELAELESNAVWMYLIKGPEHYEGISIVFVSEPITASVYVTSEIGTQLFFDIAKYICDVVNEAGSVLSVSAYAVDSQGGKKPVGSVTLND